MRRNGRKATKATRRKRRPDSHALRVLNGHTPRLNGHQPPRITVTLDRTINLGGYSNSAKVGMIISSVEAGITDAEIDELLDTGKIVYDKMRLELAERVRDRRKEEAHPY